MPTPKRINTSDWAKATCRWIKNNWCATNVSSHSTEAVPLPQGLKPNSMTQANHKDDKVAEKDQIGNYDS